MSAVGRHLRHATTRAEGLVLISKLLFPKRDFQQCDLPGSAKTGHWPNRITYSSNRPNTHVQPLLFYTETNERFRPKSEH